MEFWSEEMEWKGMSNDSWNLGSSKVEVYRSRIDKAQSFSDIWEIVKDTVKESSGEHRSGMLLFLDDLPLRLGAYYPLGTNNIILNRALVGIVERATGSQSVVNAFVYNLLVHEYVHALGHIPEAEVRSLVYKISKACFGEDHIVVKLAEEGPWSLLKEVPLSSVDAPKGALEIVKDFEEPSQRYII